MKFSKLVEEILEAGSKKDVFSAVTKIHRLLGLYIQVNKIFEKQGQERVQAFEAMLKELGGYETVNEFLAANPEAVQALVEWIGDNLDKGTWAKNLKEWMAKRTKGKTKKDKP